MQLMPLTNTVHYFQRTRPAYDEPDTSLTDVEQRNHLLQQLLMLLNSAASAGLGPKPGELGKQYEETSHAIIRVPGHNQFSYKRCEKNLPSVTKGIYQQACLCVHMFWGYY